MWETFIKIETGLSYPVLYDMIRFKIYSLISTLLQREVVDWYCFLIHGRGGGVPTSEDDTNVYFHIRFSLKKDVKPEDFLSLLPVYCVMTREIKPEWVARISIDKNVFMDTSLFQTEEIEEAWRVIGEQSEWLLNMLNIYKEKTKITPVQVLPFLHYYANMAQLDVRLK